MKIANITMDKETLEVTFELTKQFKKLEWGTKADALQDTMDQAFNEFRTLVFEQRLDDK
jgi:hypothetical protein